MDHYKCKKNFQDGRTIFLEFDINFDDITNRLLRKCSIVRAALKKSRSDTPVDVLESIGRENDADPAYSYVRHSSSRSPMHESGQT